MNNPQDIIISFYEYMTAKVSRFIPLLEALESIKQGKYKSLIEQAREAYGSDQKKYKVFKDNLPLFIFGGTFKGTHAIQNLITYNNLLILDIDKLDVEKLKSLREVLSSDKFIFSHFISPSGAGIKALIRTNNEIQDHKLIFDYFKAYFLEKYNTILDKSGSNPNRTCYVSYDDELYLNINSEIFKMESEDKTALHRIVKREVNTRKISKDTRNLKVSYGLNNSHDRIIN